MVHSWYLLMVLKVFLLVDPIGYLDRIEVGCTERNELWISDGRVLRRTLGTYDVTDIGLSW